MKISINREQVINILLELQPITASWKSEHIKITTTNSAIYIVAIDNNHERKFYCPAEIITKGRIVINAKELFEIINKINMNTITIHETEGRYIEINDYYIVGMNPDDFCIDEDVEEPKSTAEIVEKSIEQFIDIAILDPLRWTAKKNALEEYSLGTLVSAIDSYSTTSHEYIEKTVTKILDLYLQIEQLKLELPKKEEYKVCSKEDYKEIYRQKNDVQQVPKALDVLGGSCETQGKLRSELKIMGVVSSHKLIRKAVQLGLVQEDIQYNEFNNTKLFRYSIPKQEEKQEEDYIAFGPGSKIPLSDYKNLVKSHHTRPKEESKDLLTIIHEFKTDLKSFETVLISDLFDFIKEKYRWSFREFKGTMIRLQSVGKINMQSHARKPKEFNEQESGIEVGDTLYVSFRIINQQEEKS